MPKIRATLLGVLIVGAAVSGQTTDLGQHAFTSNQGDIVLTIDAALAARRLDRPYVMFMAYMVVRDGRSFVVPRQGVTMTYKGQEYTMPSLKEWRDSYKGGQGDATMYGRLGKESLILSHLRNYAFPSDQDFFPVLGRESLPTDRGSMSGMVGFRTKLYFKNPGFQDGDELVITVRDKDDPEIYGSCAVILKKK